MIRFIVIFILIQGVLNAYVFLKIRRAFQCRRGCLTSLAGLMLVMMLLPVGIRIAGMTAQWNGVQAVAHFGFTWIVVVLWFCCAGWIIDVWNMFSGLAGRQFSGIARLRIAPRPALAAVVIVIVVLAITGWIGNQGLVRTTCSIASDRIPAGAVPLRIALVTDLHYGFVRGDTYLAETTAALREMKPDMVVLTGDMLDVSGPRAQPFVDALAAITPPLGKYAVLGNHEYYVRVHKSVQLLEQAGCRVLRGTNINVDAGGWSLMIAGVDDPAGHRSEQESFTDEDPLLPAAGERQRPFTLLLKHQPFVAQKSCGRFDLQLSGHTHGGQLLPFKTLVRLRNQYFCGLYDLPAGGQVYIGRGTGSWGPPLRHNAPREITLFILMPKS